MPGLVDDFTKEALGTDTDPLDGSGSGVGGWFCIAVTPGRCACGRMVEYASDPKHRIIVWPAEDDPNMARATSQMPEARPTVKEYERSMGECVSFYELTPS